MKLERSYTHGHAVADDGTVAFDCSQDAAEWPWLALGPHHPVVVQAQNFWASVGAAFALGNMEEGQWSALTWTSWTCSEPGVGHAARGHYSRETRGDDETFTIALEDAAGRKIVTMHGRGVVFRNRNFEQWRDAAKAKVRAEAEAAGADGLELAKPDFAPAGALGLGPGECPLVGHGDKDDADRFTALVDRENALPPANLVLSGSGDHVNTVHMVEAARQALCLMKGDPQPAICGGEMTLTRYVELGTPFVLTASDRGAGEGGMDERAFSLEQLGRRCAEISLRLRP